MSYCSCTQEIIRLCNIYIMIIAKSKNEIRIYQI